MLDKKDRQILKILQHNSKTTNIKISQEIGLAPSGTLKRIKAMEDSGIISRYALNLNNRVFGYEFLAFVFIKTEKSFPGNVSEELSKIENVLELHAIAGEYSYLAKVITKTNTEYLELINQICSIEHVIYTNATIVVQTYTENNNIPIELNAPKKKMKDILLDQ